MASCTTNLHLALLILYSMPHLSVGSELKILKQFCMNSGDCFHLIALETQGEGKVLIDPVSWDDAFTKCRSLGGRLAVVNNQHVQEEIENHFTTVDHDAFKTEGNKHAWIAGRKDDTWRWIDGREHSESQIRFNRTGEDSQRCAVATHYAEMHTYTCASEVASYVCTFKDKACPGRPTHEGWHGATCSGMYGDGRNWLSARRTCLSKGGVLFSLLPGYDGHGLGNIIAESEEAWIGLQRDFWQWIVPKDGSQDKETTPMQYWNWAKGESSDGGEQCLYMDLQTRAKWRDKPCEYSNYFICENILPQIPTTPTTTTTTTTPTPTKSSTIPTRSPSVSWLRLKVRQTTPRSATVLPTAPTTKPAAISTTSIQMFSNGTRDTLSSTAAPSLSASSITWIAVVAVLAFVVVIVVVGFVLKIRSMGSRVEILQNKITHLRRSERGTPPGKSQYENSTNPLPAISPSTESTDNKGLYTGRVPCDPPSNTPSVYNIPYAEVGDVPHYVNLPRGAA